MSHSVPQGSVIKKGTVEYATLKERIESAIAAAREAIADADQSIAHAQQRLQQTQETLQHIQARRERDAERRAPLGIPASSPSSRNSSPPRRAGRKQNLWPGKIPQTN